MVAKVATKGKTKAFLQWKWFWRNAKLFRKKAIKYIAHFQRSTLSKAFRGFVGAVAAARVNRTRVEQCLLRLKKRLAWQALHALRSFAKDRHQAKLMYVFCAYCDHTVTPQMQH